MASSKKIFERHEIILQIKKKQIKFYVKLLSVKGKYKIK